MIALQQLAIRTKDALPTKLTALKTSIPYSQPYTEGLTPISARRGACRRTRTLKEDASLLLRATNQILRQLKYKTCNMGAAVSATNCRYDANEHTAAAAPAIQKN